MPIISAICVLVMGSKLFNNSVMSPADRDSRIIFYYTHYTSTNHLRILSPPLQPYLKRDDQYNYLYIPT